MNIDKQNKLKKEYIKTYIVLYWAPEGHDDKNQPISTPYFSIFDDREVAESVCRVRNAVFIEVEGKYRILDILDYYRRDDNDKPMPFKVNIIKKNAYAFFKQINGEEGK